jgi:hypothetical protein
MLSVALFDDLSLDPHGSQPLVTGDIPQPASPADLETPELLQLAELAVSPGEASAGWIQDVASSLTTTERKVLEQGGPSIVVRGVVMRMRLAKTRAVGNRVPRDLFERCVELVEELADDPVSEDIADVSEIRTWFIRELAA